MKRIVLMMLACVMLVTLLAPAAYAAEEDETTEAAENTETTEETTEETEGEEDEEETKETEETREPVSTATSGTLGNMTWKLEGTTLTVTGSGEMDKGAPWAHLSDKVKKLVLRGGVTTVAEEAFQDFDALTSIDFGGSLKEIGPRGFLGSEALESISMPATFRRFGQEAFKDCSSLTEVYCSGPMPSFRGNCLGNGNHITVYHGVSNPWPREEVDRLTTNLGGRIEIIAGNGSNLFALDEPEETTVPTEAPTEPETEPATEPATVPTEPPTEPPTVPVTQPVTEAAAEEFTGPDWQEELEMTEAPREEEGALSSRSWIGLVLIVGVLTFVVAGALVVRSMSRKDGRYTE